MKTAGKPMWTLKAKCQAEVGAQICHIAPNYSFHFMDFILHNLLDHPQA